MTFQKIQKNNHTCVVVESEAVVITDVSSATDMLMNVQYTAETKSIAIHKSLITEDFFILSKGLAGEILQKFINYGGRIAIYGDFSRYTSKPLQDFIRESNKGTDVFFVETEEEAVERLTR